MSNKYFLPYQIRWLRDKSPVKISEKSRRIGMTFAQSYEDVEDCVKGRVPAVWFSSADDSAAVEYIEYCKRWSAIHKVAFESIDEELTDKETTHTIRFKNGSKIIALSSNPKNFRSKGGKVVLDEYAFHEDQEAMWKAARPAATWGYPIRILSTYNGKGNRYYKFIERIKKGELSWSLHKTDIYEAVDEGLYDKIMKRPTTPLERKAWIESLKADCFDEDTFLQEYCCIPVDEATAFLTYDLIQQCEGECLWHPDQSYGYEASGDLFVGFDVARKKDLSVIYTIEKIGALKYTREVKVLEKMSFARQREELFSRLTHPRVRRCAIDATGLGMQMAEETQEQFGKYRIEAITFTANSKSELAFGFKSSLEDKRTILPADRALREDFHSMRKVVGLSGNIRFDADKSETDGHADRFWAGALANYAATDISGEVWAVSRSIKRGYSTNGF